MLLTLSLGGFGHDGVGDWVARNIPGSDAVTSFWVFFEQYLHWHGEFFEGSCKSHIACGMNSLIDLNRPPPRVGPTAKLVGMVRLRWRDSYHIGIRPFLGYVLGLCDEEKSGILRANP